MEATEKSRAISFDSRNRRTRGISSFVDEIFLYQPAPRTFHGSLKISRNSFCKIFILKLGEIHHFGQNSQKK